MRLLDFTALPTVGKSKRQLKSLREQSYTRRSGAQKRRKQHNEGNKKHRYENYNSNCFYDNVLGPDPCRLRQHGTARVYSNFWFMVDYILLRKFLTREYKEENKMNKNPMVNKQELQQLYTLKGKIEAINAYVNGENYPDYKIILSILGIEKKGEKK